MPDIPHHQPCPHCGRYDNRPITVDALVIHNGRILLIKRGAEPFKNYWAIPGGHVDWDETVEQAVTRELSEETGLSVTSLRLFGAYSSPDRHPKQAVALAHLVTVDYSAEPQWGSDALDGQWWSLDELPDQLAFDHRQMITDAATSLSTLSAVQ